MNWLTPGALRIRLILVLVAVGIILGTTAASVVAQTTAAITIVDDTPVDDEGTLSVSWTSSNAVFLANGDASALTAANPSATVSANFTLAIEDTRTDSTRSGYTVSLRAGVFTAEGSPSVIGPELLAIVNVTGLPDGASPAMAVGQSFQSPITLLTVASGSAAVSTTVTIIIEMTLPPGTMPGTYQGSITYDVVPVTGP